MSLLSTRTVTYWTRIPNKLRRDLDTEAFLSEVLLPTTTSKIMSIGVLWPCTVFILYRNENTAQSTACQWLGISNICHESLRLWHGHDLHAVMFAGRRPRRETELNMPAWVARVRSFRFRQIQSTEKCAEELPVLWSWCQLGVGLPHFSLKILTQVSSFFFARIGEADAAGCTWNRRQALRFHCGQGLCRRSQATVSVISIH